MEKLLEEAMKKAEGAGMKALLDLSSAFALSLRGEIKATYNDICEFVEIF